MTIARLTLLILISAFATMSGSAHSQTYPDRAIRIIVPFPPGAGSDTAARVVAEALAQGVGQSVVVENRPGAVGLIGSEMALRAPADGYTLLLCSTEIFAINKAAGIAMPFDPIRDVAYISAVGQLPLMLVASKNSGIASFEDLIRKAKDNPGKLTFASLGATSPHQLYMDRLKQLVGIDILSVPFKGVADASTALAGGHVDLIFMGQANGMEMVRSGRAAAIASMAEERTQFAPDVPTFKEVGRPELVIDSWFALAAPAGTPAPVVARLNAEIVRIMRAPETAQRYSTIGMRPWSLAPVQVQERIEKDVATFSAILKANAAAK